MKALATYYSRFGNTRRIAEAIAETLAHAGSARALCMEELCADDLHDADLVVVGSPTHYQAVPKTVRAILKALPRGSLKGKWVATFDTSLEMSGPIMLLTAAHGVMGRLRRLGGKKAVRAESFLVKAGDSPPEGEPDLLYDGEVERAREWAQAVLERIG